MAEKIELKQMFQVCVVVKDIQKSVEQYWNIFGIGPWQIRTFQPPDLSDTTLRGKPELYTMKIAAAQIGNIQWELIQPLGGRSGYHEFLEEKGEGLHHIAVVVEDFDKAVAAFEKHGIGTVMTGKFKESTYAYLDTAPALGFITEILKMPPGFEMPRPDAVYPSSV
jgi:methylmalonyl-CoA/ethylmalonyl-CoA epimerase